MWSFNPTEYWLDRGKSYFGEQKRLEKPYFVQQAALIVHTVKRLNPEYILELGCGYGRVTRQLARAMPAAKVTGMDLSPEQVRNARDLYCHDANVAFVAANVVTLPSFLRHDVCVASELFLHLQRYDLLKLVPKILKACPVLIHDFDVTPVDFVSPHIHAHDYEEVYGTLGLNAEEQIHRTDDGDIGLMVVRA